MIVPVFLPHLGCQSRCIYCNQNDITGEREGDVRLRVEKALRGKQGTYEVGLFGGNIFGVGHGVMRSLLGAFDQYRGSIEGFRISTKPVPPSEETLGLLKEAGTTIIELGAPSFNDRQLLRLNRGHSVQDVLETYSLLREAGFGVALQVMVGLPGETADDIVRTADNLLRLRPDYVRIYPLALLGGTPLARLVGSGCLSLPPFNAVLAAAVSLYRRLGKEGIRIASMGLTDGEVLRENVIGGAYHPAFGFLVKAEAFFDAVAAVAERNGMEGPVLVRLNARDVPHLVGHRRQNIERFVDRGLAVSWEHSDEAPSHFRLVRGSCACAGTVFDAHATG